MKAAEPAPRTQPYSNGSDSSRSLYRDQESASASDSGASGASMAACNRFTKTSSSNECAGK